MAISALRTLWQHTSRSSSRSSYSTGASSSVTGLRSERLATTDNAVVNTDFGKAHAPLRCRWAVLLRQLRASHQWARGRPLLQQAPSQQQHQTEGEDGHSDCGCCCCEYFEHMTYQQLRDAAAAGDTHFSARKLHQFPPHSARQHHQAKVFSIRVPQLHHNTSAQQQKQTPQCAHRQQQSGQNNKLIHTLQHVRHAYTLQQPESVVHSNPRGVIYIQSRWLNFKQRGLHHTSSRSHQNSSSSISHCRDTCHKGETDACNDICRGCNRSNMEGGRRSEPGEAHRGSNNQESSSGGSRGSTSTKEREYHHRLQRPLRKRIPLLSDFRRESGTLATSSLYREYNTVIFYNKHGGGVGLDVRSFSCSCAATAAATDDAVPGTPLEGARNSRPRIHVSEARDGSTRREAALLQVVLPRRLRMAFPYVVPAFRPLVLLAALPVDQQISTDKSDMLRLAAVRRGHALLPPFVPQTEDLWCTYTRWLLTDPAAALRQHLGKSRDTETSRQRDGQSTTIAGASRVSERKKTRIEASGQVTTEGRHAASENIDDRRNTEPADKENSDECISSGKQLKHEGEERLQGRPVQIGIVVGELLGQLLATRNVTLQAPWRLFFSAVEPTLQRLQQQQQQQRQHQKQVATGTENAIASREPYTTTGIGDSRSCSSSSSDSEVTEDNRDYLEIVLRLLNAASRVRHQWKWGLRQIEQAARRDFPAFEKEQALRVLHALSSSKEVDHRLCERLVDAFVFLWRTDFSEAKRLQPTEGLLLLDSFSQRKQLLDAVPDPFFLKHICRRLHSYVHLGLLTPWEKTRLCDFYKHLKMPHFTYFSHIAAEVMQQQQNRQNLLAEGHTGAATLPTPDEQQHQQQQARRKRLANIQKQLLLGPAAASSMTAAGTPAAPTTLRESSSGDGTPEGTREIDGSTKRMGSASLNDKTRAQPAALTAPRSTAATPSTATAAGAAAKTEIRTSSMTAPGSSSMRATGIDITLPTAAGVKEWRYIEYSRRDYVMGCGIATDFTPSGVILEQPVLPLLTVETIRKLRKGKFGCHHINNISKIQGPQQNEDTQYAVAAAASQHVTAAGEDAVAPGDAAETFERTDLPQHTSKGSSTASTITATLTPPATAQTAATIAAKIPHGIREFTAGQMAVIADAMLFLNMHHQTRFAEPVLSVVGERFSGDHTLVHFLDPQQCASVMICFGEKKHRLPQDSPLLQLLTNRFVDMVIAEIASPAQCVLFFQALVKWTTRKVVERHERKPQWKQRKNSYISLDWLHAPPPPVDTPTLPPTSSESLLLLLCKQVCKRVHSFTMQELTRILRAIAYLNFPEQLFFKTFSSFCMQRLGDMGVEDIANITQAFNRAGVEDPYLFSMMGKRYQQLQAKVMAIKHRGVLVRRIG